MSFACRAFRGEEFWRSITDKIFAERGGEFASFLSITKRRSTAFSASFYFDGNIARRVKEASTRCLTDTFHREGYRVTRYRRVFSVCVKEKLNWKDRISVYCNKISHLCFADDTVLTAQQCLWHVQNAAGARRRKKVCVEMNALTTKKICWRFGDRWLGRSFYFLSGLRWIYVTATEINNPSEDYWMAKC